MKIIRATVLVLLAAPVAAQQRATNPATAAIWTAVIDAAYSPESGIALADSSLDLQRAPRGPDKWLPRYTGADSAALADMLTQNRTAVALDSTLLLAVVRPGKMRRWVRLALPGFNAPGQVAFVYGHFTCGSGCGWDEGFVLELHAGRWTVVARRRYSIT